MSQLQVTGEAKIRDIQGPVVANSGVITALDGAASQYVRGDGTLADFPTSSGGGSSVSYYLNSSVSQGTIGGVAYRELSKEPIIGAGTDIAISANGYVASYLTDANDPDVVLIPGGNFNCEFYFSVNNNTGNPFFYAELYKYDGTTFTLLGSSVGVPEYITQGTVINPYYFAIPVATATLALTDRLAIRIYVNVDGRTVTLHTENGHLCQVVTTLSKGMVSLNNLTDQSQFLAVGTSGTDFNIVSSGDTHTFNIPSASASNRGLITTGSQTIAGIKTLSVPSQFEQGLYLKQNMNLFQAGYIGLGASTTGLIVGLSGGGFGTLNFNNTTSFTYTFPDASGTVALTSNLSSYVPYTGATGDVNLGLFSIISNRVSAIGDNSTYGGTLSIKQNNVRSLLGTGYTELFGKTNILGISFGVGSIANLSNSVLTAERTFTLPDLSGTLALLEESQTFSGSKTFSALTAFTFTNGTRMDYGLYLSKGSIPSAFSSSTTNIYSDATTNNIVIRDNSSNAKLVFNNSTQTYTFPAATGTIALTSNLSSYVPYTGATTNVDLGVRNLSSFGINVNGDGTGGGALNLKMYNSLTLAGVGYLSIYAQTDYYFGLAWNFVSGTKQAIFNNVLIPINNTRYYNLPNADGTLALTSDLSAYLPLTGGTLTGALIGTSATFSGTVSSIVTSGGTSFRVVNSVNSRAWSLVPSTNGAESDLWLYYGGTGTGTKVSFVNNGNVLIGSTTDSGELLQVNGTSKFTGALSGTSASFSSGVTSKETETTRALILNGRDSDNLVRIDFFRADTTTFIGRIQMDNGTNSNMSIRAQGALQLQTGGSTNRLVIDSTGAATFSAATSAITLTTNGAANQWTSKVLANSTTGQSYGLTVQAGTNSSDIGFQVIPVSGSGALLYVRGDGNVGIGTSSPSYRLHVQSTSGTIARITDGTNNLDFYAGSSLNEIAATTTMLFSTNNAERMRITSGGAVAINTTNTTYAQLNIKQANGNLYGGAAFYSNNGTESFLGIGNTGSVCGLFATYGASGAYLPITFSTGGNESMRITSGGSVGIGTDTPSALLTVSSIGFDDTFFRVEQRRSNYASAINLVGANDAGASYNRISSQTNGGSTHWQIGGGGVANTMAFLTGGSERMRITSGGNVLIGTTSTALLGLATISYNTNDTPNPTLLVRNGGGNAAFISFSDSGGSTTLYGWIVRSGSGVNYASASDYRLKENVIPIENALSRVSKLNPVSYDWKIDGSKDEGFIAHELQEVIPYAVNGEKDGEQMQGVDYSKIVPILVKAIQEQQAQIEELKELIKNK